MLYGSKNNNELLVRRRDIDLSDKELLFRYTGISKIPCMINSPLRDDDKNPSFAFFEHDGKIFWKDFGTIDSGDIISFFAKIWKCDRQATLDKIKEDTGTPLPSASLIRHYKGKLRASNGSDIQVTIRAWQSWDTDYWNQYGISKKMCKFCNVYPVSHAFFTKEEDRKQKTICVPMEKYAYVYFEWKDKQSLKLYQPYSTKMKWLSKHNSLVWDLWRQVMNNENFTDKVILTSSRKDAMCLWENLKIPAMALQGEGYIPDQESMNKVLCKFKTIYIWYDNDYQHTDGHNPGQENAWKIISLYPFLHNIVIPKQYKSKDPSDLFKNHGKETLIKIFNEQK